MKYRGASWVSPLLFALLIAPPLWAQTRPESRSLIELIARPETFNGKHVRVIGYVVLGFENRAVYLTKESAEHGIFRNGLWLELEKELDTEQIKTLVNHQYAV